jgi:antitoxin ParD1/3/4
LRRAHAAGPRLHALKLLHREAAAGQLEELVRQKVSSGLYNSASEVVREALRLMEREDQVRAAKLAQLRQDIQEGLQSGSAGELDVQAIKRRGRERLAARKQR